MLIATQDYEPGQVVVPAERPLVHVLKDKHKFKRCDECFAILSHEIITLCTGCKRMSYCSETCKNRNWTGGHHWECPILMEANRQHGGSETPNEWFGCKQSTTFRMLLRTWLLKKYKPNLLSRSCQLPTGKLRTYDDLMSHSDTMSSKSSFIEYLNEVLIPKFEKYSLINEENRKTAANELLEIWGKFRTNSFCICAPDAGVTLGSGLYVIGSVFNHSCRPNLQENFTNGIDMEFRAICPIRAGDELSSSYIDLCETTAQRRAHLETYYFFTCHCVRCTEIDASRDAQLDEEVAVCQLEVNQAKIVELLSNGGGEDHLQAKQLMQGCIPLMASLLPSQHHSTFTAHLCRLAEVENKQCIPNNGT